MSYLQVSEATDSCADTAVAFDDLHGASPAIAVTGTFRVLLIDRLAMLRQCLAYALQAAAKEFLVLSAGSPAEAGTVQPDIIILNIHAACIDSPEVLQDLAALRQRYDHGTPIVVVTDLSEIRGALDAIRHRLRGYIPTSLNAAIAVAAIRLVLAGGSFFPAELLSLGPAEPASKILPAAAARVPAVPAPSAEPAGAFGLTVREAEVANLLRQGKPNKIIAFELNISESTVKVHLRSMMKKLHATNRTEAVCRIQNMIPRLEAAEWTRSGAC